MRSLVSPQLRTLLRPQVLRASPRFMRIQTAALSSAISDTIIQDHRELEKYYNEVINSTDHGHQQRFGNQLVWELARHSIGEELVVYPAFEKYMGLKGQEMADSDRQEHHKVGPRMNHGSRKTYNFELDQGTSQRIPEHEIHGFRLRAEAQGTLGRALAAHPGGGEA
jgi:hypothetical protein